MYAYQTHMQADMPPPWGQPRLFTEEEHFSRLQIPAEVLRQLKMVLSEVELLRLPPGTLDAAVHSFRRDATVFDDPEGESVADMLVREPEEDEDDPWRTRQRQEQERGYAMT